MVPVPRPRWHQNNYDFSLSMVHSIISHQPRPSLHCKIVSASVSLQLPVLFLLDSELCDQFIKFTYMPKYFLTKECDNFVHHKNNLSISSYYWHGCIMHKWFCYVSALIHTSFYYVHFGKEDSMGVAWNPSNYCSFGAESENWVESLRCSWNYLVVFEWFRDNHFYYVSFQSCSSNITNRKTFLSVRKKSYTILVLVAFHLDVSIPQETKHTIGKKQTSNKKQQNRTTIKHTPLAHTHMYSSGPKRFLFLQNVPALSEHAHDLQWRKAMQNISHGILKLCIHVIV